MAPQFSGLGSQNVLKEFDMNSIVKHHEKAMQEYLYRDPSVEVLQLEMNKCIM